MALDYAIKLALGRDSFQDLVVIRERLKGKVAMTNVCPTSATFFPYRRRDSGGANLVVCA